MPNPYEVVGTRFSKEEFELVQMGLVSIASEAETHGNTEIHHRCMDLIQRLQQYVVAGQGVPQELAEKFGKKFSDAVMANDNKAIILSLRSWTETLIRLEPDPARSIAKHVIKLLFMAADAAQKQKIHGALSLVSRKVKALEARYDSELPTDILTYIHTWIDHGKNNLEAGNEPWTGDEDLTDD